VIGSVGDELHIEDCSPDAAISDVEVGPTSVDGEVKDPSEAIVDGSALADDSDHTDEGLSAAALVDTP
jgi:hypothetical protein